mmetsp:Transcript_41984/g.136224  ORF Transcript_41984/g.136224 Transcript_41984/m.136224 type:complete len:488 (+) Transcript_41984:225-1688(+)
MRWPPLQPAGEEGAASLRTTWSCSRRTRCSPPEGSCRRQAATGQPPALRAAQQRGCLEGGVAAEACSPSRTRTSGAAGPARRCSKFAPWRWGVRSFCTPCCKGEARSSSSLCRSTPRASPASAQLRRPSPRCGLCFTCSGQGCCSRSSAPSAPPSSTRQAPAPPRSLSTSAQSYSWPSSPICPPPHSAALLPFPAPSHRSPPTTRSGASSSAPPSATFLPATSPPRPPPPAPPPPPHRRPPAEPPSGPTPRGWTRRGPPLQRRKSGGGCTNKYCAMALRGTATSTPRQATSTLQGPSPSTPGGPTLAGCLSPSPASSGATLTARPALARCTGAPPASARRLASPACPAPATGAACSHDTTRLEEGTTRSSTQTASRGSGAASAACRWGRAAADVAEAAADVSLAAACGTRTGPGSTRVSCDKRSKWDGRPWMCLCGKPLGLPPAAVSGHRWVRWLSAICAGCRVAGRVAGGEMSLWACVRYIAASGL